MKQEPDYYKNLIKKDFSKMPNHKELASKGGKARTPRKQWAAKLRELRKKGLSNQDYRYLYSIMTEKESFVLDSFLRVSKWTDECENMTEKAVMEKLKIDLMKFLHGQKLEAVATHHVINWTEVFKNCVIEDETSELEEDS